MEHAPTALYIRGELLSTVKQKKFARMLKITAYFQDFYGDDAAENGFIRRFMQEDVRSFIATTLRAGYRAEVLIVCKDADIHPQRNIDLGMISEGLRHHLGSIMHFDMHVQDSYRHKPNTKAVSLVCDLLP